MRKSLYITLLILLYTIISPYEVEAFWVWMPKSKKLVNAKYAVKDTPSEQFKWAMKFFDEKDYKLAAQEFLRLVENFTDSSLAPEAQYYAGRSFEAAGKPYTAFQSYQKAIESYPFIQRIDEIIERQYNLGKLLYTKHRARLMGREIMTDLDRAVEIFQEVRLNAPFGEYADKSQFMVGECYKKSEQYNEAIKAFQELIDDYPKSELAEKAKYEVAQCTYLASLKPDYDQELTDEAIEEFKKIAGAESAVTTSKEASEAVLFLEDKRAESLFKTAKFYERQKKYKSAAIYYREILDRYPRSSFIKSAIERLQDIDKKLEKG